MIANTIATYNVNAASYNAGTGIWQFSYNPTPLATGVWCGTLTTTGGVLPTGYSLTAVYFLFFRTTGGSGFGLANSYANALAEVPVIFTTGGTGSLVFKKQGGYYNLQARVPECCDEQYFNQQYPSYAYSDDENFFPDKVPAAVTITPNFVRNINPFLGSGPSLASWYESEAIAAIALMNNTVALYLTGAGNSETTPSPSCQFYQTITTADFYVFYSLAISATGGCLLSISVLNRRNFSSVYVIYTGSFIGLAPNPATFYSQSFNVVDSVSVPAVSFSSAPLTSMVLPATLTLTKKPATYLHTLPDVITSNAPYPTRGWTTNDYTSELPDSITLTKVAGYNNYEGEFTTAVNVKNYVRLKLVGSTHGHKYADYGMFSSYAGNASKYLPSTDFSYSGYSDGGTYSAYNAPTAVTRNAAAYGYTNLYLQEISLFRMEGIPLLTSSGYVVSKCKGFANYYLENP